eukprot:4105210-Prymnesium_polylepis.1
MRDAAGSLRALEPPPFRSPRYRRVLAAGRPAPRRRAADAPTGVVLPVHAGGFASCGRHEFGVAPDVDSIVPIATREDGQDEKPSLNEREKPSPLLAVLRINVVVCLEIHEACATQPFGGPTQHVPFGPLDVTVCGGGLMVAWFRALPLGDLYARAWLNTALKSTGFGFECHPAHSLTKSKFVFAQLLCNSIGTDRPTAVCIELEVSTDPDAFVGTVT